MNEVTVDKQLDFSVEYKPTTITINNQDKLNQAIDAYINRYKNLVVTEQTLTDDKKVKQQLSSLKKQLNAKRIEIHKDFDQPYVDFKSEIDDMVERINQVIDPISAGISKFEEHQKQQRLAEVKALIDEMAPNYHVKSDEIEVDESWLTKSISKKKRLNAIADAMTLKNQENKQLAEGITAIQNYAKALGLEADGWVKQLEQGQELSYIQEAMQNAVDKRDKELAYKKAIAKSKVAQQGNKNIDPETGEVIEEKSVTLKITGSLQELYDVRYFLDEHQINFERVKNQ